MTSIRREFEQVVGIEYACERTKGLLRKQQQYFNAQCCTLRMSVYLNPR